jgi:hypothetical protein
MQRAQAAAMLLIVGVALLSLQLAAAVPSIYVQERLSIETFEKPW